MAKVFKRVVCVICGGHLRSDNTKGVCQRTPECKAELNRLYYEANKTAIKACRQQYRHKNRNVLNLKALAYRRKHSKRIRAWHREYYAAHRDAIRDRQRRRYAATHGIAREAELARTGVPADA